MHICVSFLCHIEMESSTINWKFSERCDLVFLIHLLPWITQQLMKLMLTGYFLEDLFIHWMHFEHRLNISTGLLTMKNWRRPGSCSQSSASWMEASPQTLLDIRATGTCCSVSALCAARAPSIISCATAMFPGGRWDKSWHLTEHKIKESLCKTKKQTSFAQGWESIYVTSCPPWALTNQSRCWPGEISTITLIHTSWIWILDLFFIIALAVNSFFSVLIPFLLVKHGSNPASHHSNWMDAGIEVLHEDLKLAEIFTVRLQFGFPDFAGILVPKQLSTCLVFMG